MGNCHCYRDDVVVPEKAPNGYTVTAIGLQAFNGCDSLTSVKLPQTLKAIDEMAFQLCTELKEISIPASVERLESCFGGAGIEKMYIEDSDDEIVIGNSMVYGSLIWGMEHLRYLYVGRNFTVNNPSAEETGGPKGLLHACEQVEEVVFSNKVTQLHVGECMGAKNLKKAYVGSVAVIPDNCFDDCSSLEDVKVVPELLTALGNITKKSRVRRTWRLFP